jgi:Cu(I)/Ag(I) efflux system membrane protein CusA/SilA
VGFIALFGTGVQTVVVMVIYLEEAVAQKRQALGGRLTRAALLEAVKEGALLRLRPKVMTVTTVVASLLPIMWSHSTGAEVMKPLAAPVLGGMVSSLLHVLVVTPVIFYWLRERELRREEKQVMRSEPREQEGSMKPTITAVMVAAAILGGGLVGLGAAAEMKVIQTQKTKDAVVALKSDSGRWTPGRNAFVLEITSQNGQPLDAGNVSLSTSMGMPGMPPMVAGATLTPDKTPGRYVGTISFLDSGTRQVTVSWDGPAGKGSVRFSVPVR